MEVVTIIWSIICNFALQKNNECLHIAHTYRYAIKKRHGRPRFRVGVVPLSDMAYIALRNVPFRTAKRHVSEAKTALLSTC